MKQVVAVMIVFCSFWSLSAQLPSSVSGIGGVWVYEYSVGGFAGGYDTLFNYRALEFTSDGVQVETDSVLFRLYDGAGLIDTAYVRFSIGSTIKGIDRYFVEYDVLFGGNPSGSYALSAEGGQLVLYDNCFDCFHHYFFPGSIVADDEVLQEDDQLLVYPNPAETVVQIRLPNNSLAEMHLVLYDGVGKEVLRRISSDAFPELDVEGLVSGVYYLRVLRPDGSTLGSTKLLIR